MIAKITVLLVAITSLLSGCKKGNVDLDNGGDQPLTVIIDNIPYFMAAGAYKNITLETGEHTVEIRNEEGNTLKDTVISVSEGGLLNLAQAPYYIWTDLYGDPVLKETKLREDWIKIGNQNFFGEFYEIESNQLYVEKQWDYGLNEEFPEDLLGWKISSEKYLIKSKLYRADQLVEAYNSLAKKKFGQVIP